MVHPWDPCRPPKPLSTRCSTFAWSCAGEAFLLTGYQRVGWSCSSIHSDTPYLPALGVSHFPLENTGVLWPCVSSLMNWLPPHFSARFPCQVHLGSRHIFSPGLVHSLTGIGREILRLIFLLFFHSTPSLVLNTYMPCCEYVCEWIGQNSKFELQENSFVLQCTWLNMRKGTDW